MLNAIDNLIEMSLRLNKSTPILQTIQEIPVFARRPRSRREQRSGNGPLYYMIVRRKPEEFFIFRILYAVKLNVHLLTFNLFEEKFFNNLLVLNLLSIQ